MAEKETIIERKVGEDIVRMDHKMGGAIIEFPPGFDTLEPKSQAVEEEVPVVELAPEPKAKTAKVTKPKPDAT